MADENISVALTDDGTIEQVSGLLEVFGVTAEAAAQRAQGAFVNVSKSQDAAAASAKLLATAQQAGVTALDTLELAVSKLTTTELQAATQGERLAVVAQALAVAQTEGVTAAVALANALAEEASSLGAIGGAADTARARFGTLAGAAEDVVAATTTMNVSQRETVALLTQFGLSAAEAASRVSEGYAGAAQGSQSLATTTAALGQAAKAGYLDVEALANAVGLLSADELRAISTTQGMAEIYAILENAVAASNSAFAAQAQIVSNQTGTFTAQANATEALAAAMQRLKDFMEADAATAAELAASMRGLAAAEGEAGAAAVSASEKFAAIKEAGAGIASTFGGLNAIFAGAFATSEIIHASDEFLKMNGTLVAVTGSARAAATAYSAIRQVANDTQTPLEANVNTFGQLSAATSHAGISAQELIGALQGIDAGLKVAGTSGQPATAALRSLAEVFETTGSATRYFQNLQRESPFLFQAIKKAADELGVSLESFGAKTGDTSERQRELSAILTRVGTDLRGQVGAVNTVGGALTVLKNNLIDYVGSSTTASVETTLLKDAIYAVATNLNIAIPAVLGLAAAVTVVKIAQLATDVVRVTSATVSWIAALNPTTLIIAGVVVGILALAKGLEALYNAFTGSHLDVFGAALDFAKAKAGDLGTALGGVSSSMQKAAQNASAGAVATNGLANAATAADTAHVGLTNTLVGTGTAAGETYKAVSVLGAGHDATAASTDNDNTAHTVLQNTLTGTATKADTTYKTFSVLTAATTDNTTATNDNAKALTAQSTEAQKSADATKAAGDAAANSVSGWQKLTNGINAAIAAVASYISKAAGVGSLGGTGGSDGGAAVSGAARVGGTFSVPGGSGVDSKLIAVSPGEVVTVQTPAQYRMGVAPAKNAGQTHFATGGVTTGAGVDLGTGVQLTGLDPGGSVLGYSDQSSTAILTLSEATTASTKATNDNTAAVSDLTSAITEPTTAAATTTPGAGIFVNGGLGAAFAPAAYMPTLGGGSVTNPGTSGAVSIVDSQGRDASGASVGDDSAQKAIDAARAYDNSTGGGILGQKVLGSATVLNNQEYHARDGADFYVPGGDGVDSRTLKLAVSPGESVHVRTPAQRSDSASVGTGNTQVVNVTVQAKDAGSFRASSNQLTSTMVRGLRRAARRN